MRIEEFRTNYAEMTAPDRFGKRDLQRLARLARRLGRTARVWTYHPRLLRPDVRELLRDEKRETLLSIDHEWDGECDGYEAMFLDLIEEAGWNTLLYSRLEEGVYRAEASVGAIDPEYCRAVCTGTTRTQAAAGLALWVERQTRPKGGALRYGPQRRRA